MSLNTTVGILTRRGNLKRKLDWKSVFPDHDDIDLEEGDRDDDDNECSGQSSKSPDSSDDSQTPDHDEPMGHLGQVMLGGSHFVCYML